MASSNTVLRPRCVKAEHSRYFTESVGRKAGAVMGRKRTGVGSGSTHESAAEGPQKRNMQEEYYRSHQAGRDACAYTTGRLLAHIILQPQHPPSSVPILQCSEAYTHHLNTPSVSS